MSRVPQKNMVNIDGELFRTELTRIMEEHRFKKVRLARIVAKGKKDPAGALTKACSLGRVDKEIVGQLIKDFGMTEKVLMETDTDKEAQIEQTSLVFPQVSNNEEIIKKLDEIICLLNELLRRWS